LNYKKDFRWRSGATEAAVEAQIEASGLLFVFLVEHGAPRAIKMY